MSGINVPPPCPNPQKPVLTSVGKETANVIKNLETEKLPWIM